MRFSLWPQESRDLPERAVEAALKERYFKPASGELACRRKMKGIGGAGQRIWAGHVVGCYSSGFIYRGTLPERFSQRGHRQPDSLCLRIHAGVVTPKVQGPGGLLARPHDGGFDDLLAGLFFYGEIAEVSKSRAPIVYQRWLHNLKQGSKYH